MRLWQYVRALPMDILWMLPLLAFLIHLVPIPMLRAPWDVWTRLWGEGRWPLTFALAMVPFFKETGITQGHIHPLFITGGEIAGWAILGLASALTSGGAGGGIVGSSLIQIISMTLGPPFILPVLVVLLGIGLGLIYLYSPWVLDREILSQWGLWVRAQLAPWLGWHLPAQHRPVHSPARNKRPPWVERLHARWRQWRTPPTPSQERILPPLEVETGYALPPLSLLHREDMSIVPQAEQRKKARLIRETLKNFGVPVRIVEVNVGPAVTQYCVQPLTVTGKGGQKRRVSVRKILALQHDLALMLAAPAIRIEAPVPGKPYVGIEVPNTQTHIVPLGGVIASEEFQRLRSPLALALGRDVTGHPVVADLVKLPHLLIAGATGSGKSVAITGMLITWLMRNTPYDLRVILVDPKRVELTHFANVPHLLGPVITEIEDVIRALTWLLLQMDDRYRAFERVHARNLRSYNTWARRHQRPTLPYIVLVIDELADIMLAAGDQVEQMLIRLAQMARATGIHLVVATQRPSVDVITGLIKANFPARLAFAVTSQVDSRVILDTPGAETLLGRGDALFLSPDKPAPMRLQGAFVSDEEVDRVVKWWQEHFHGHSSGEAPWAHIQMKEEEKDEVLQEAITLVRQQERVSASLLQRKLHIGFKRAQEIMTELERQGIVGPDEGAGRGRRVIG